MHNSIRFVTLCLWQFCAVALAGCTVADTVSRETPAQLANETPFTLSMVYYDAHDPAVKAELTHRGVIPAQDWALIDQHKIAIGMSNLETLAAWGLPDGSRTWTSRRGVRSRDSYDSCKGCHKTYLYYDYDGVLTAIDD